MTPEFKLAVKRARSISAKFPPSAYELVRASVDLVVSEVFKREGKVRHVSGQEICDAFRRHALTEFGPMAATVVEDACLFQTRDLGEIVFLLIRVKFFTNDAGDKIEDFDDNFNFPQAFSQPFLPKTQQNFIPLPKAHKTADLSH